MFYYLQNEKTNVRNAKINIPKDIKSLKSDCFLFKILSSTDSNINFYITYAFYYFAFIISEAVISL